MKRLFQINDTISKKQHGTTHYERKMLAKKERIRLNDECGSELRYVVSYGPDHYRYNPNP